MYLCVHARRASERKTPSNKAFILHWKPTNRSQLEHNTADNTYLSDSPYSSGGRNGGLHLQWVADCVWPGIFRDIEVSLIQVMTSGGTDWRFRAVHMKCFFSSKPVRLYLYLWVSWQHPSVEVEDISIWCNRIFPVFYQSYFLSYTVLPSLCVFVTKISSSDLPTQQGKTMKPSNVFVFIDERILMPDGKLKAKSCPCVWAECLLHGSVVAALQILTHTQS